MKRSRQDEFNHWLKNAHGGRSLEDMFNATLGFLPTELTPPPEREKVKYVRKNRRKYLTMNGETKSVEEWAETTGIKRNTIIQRLRLGWTVEEALSTPNMCRKQLYTYEGKTLTLRQWSEETGITLSTLGNRFAQGWSVEAALTTPVGQLSGIRKDNATRRTSS